MNRRTTVTADVESLSTLKHEAARRGISLSVILGEAVEEKAAALRGRRKPRTGVARSSDGQNAVDIAVDPIADKP